jgi:hypothetical protein
MKSKGSKERRQSERDQKKESASDQKSSREEGIASPSGEEGIEDPA